MTRAWDVAVVAICALLLILTAYERMETERREQPSVYSTYDTGPNGYRALYEVLRAAGVAVQRFERPIGALDPSTRTLVVTGYENDRTAKPLDERDAALLADFVRGGGRLVAVDAQFAGSLDVAPAVGTSIQTPGGRDAVPLGRNTFTSGVARVHGSIDWAFPFKEPHGIPLLANAHGMVAVLYRFGRGDVIAVTAPALFGNAQLRDADNLRFIYNAIAGHGPAQFNEYVHGYSDNLSMWEVLPAPVHAAVWIVVAIAILAVIGANMPFAPPYLPEPSDRRTSSDYITAIARLMRRSRRRPSDDDVIRHAAIDFRRRKEHA